MVAAVVVVTVVVIVVVLWLAWQGSTLGPGILESYGGSAPSYGPGVTP